MISKKKRKRKNKKPSPGFGTYYGVIIYDYKDIIKKGPDRQEKECICGHGHEFPDGTKTISHHHMETDKISIKK